MTVLGTITPDSPTVTITPGSQPVISFTVSVPAGFVYIGSDIQFSPSVPAGWTATMDTTMTTSMSGIIVMDNYTVRYTITGTGSDTSGTFPLGLNYTINGLAAMYNDSFTSTSTETATIGVGAPSLPVLDLASDTGVLGDNITKDTTPTITGTSEANAIVKLYDTDGVTELGSTTANGAGIWSITSSTLSEGVHTVKATQTALGNTSVLSAGLALTIDVTAPAAPGTPAMTAGTDTGASSADAITSNTTPVFTGSGETGATVTLYDTNGTAELGHATVDGFGKWTITSNTLAEGTHQLTAKQVDAAGNASGAGTAKTVVIDTTAPSAPAAPGLSAGSDSGLAGDLLTNVATPVVTGIAEGNAKVRLYDTDGTTLLGSTTADGTGKWSITSSTLASGSHTLTVKQTDLAGNVSAASTGLMLEIDTSTPATPGAPVLAAASDSGTAGDNRTNIAAPQFTGTGTDGATVTLYDTDGSTVLGSAVVDGNGNWRITSMALDDGAHALTVKQSNTAGTGSTASTALSVTIDTAAPAAPSSPAMTAGTDTGLSSSDAVTSNTAPVFTGTGEIGAMVTLYDTAGSTALGHATVDGAGKWEIASSTLSQGLHQLTTRQVDAAGNASVASGALAVEIDTTAPDAPDAPVLSASSDSGLAGDLLTNVATPVVTGMAEGNAKVSLYDTDGTTLLGSTTADGTGKWSITSSTLASGSHTLTVKQTDLAGNVSAASTGLMLEIDTSTPATPGAPVLAAASDSGTAGDNRTNVAAPQFTGTGTDGATVTLYDTDGSTVLGSAVVDGNGNWRITSTTLADGAHTLTVRQSNVAGTGSAASTALNVTIDTSAPATLSTPVLAPASDSGAAGDGITSAATPVLTGTGAAGNLVTLYDTDGVTVLGSATVDGDGNWRVTSSTLADGVHAVRATQTNAAGTVSVASGAFDLTVDATAPANLKLSNGSVSNTAGANALVGRLSATDAGALGYALVAGSGDTGNASFNIDGGNLRLSNPAHTPAGSYSLRVQVTDAAGNSYQQVLRVVVVEPASTQVSTVDGVQVQSTPVALPGGGTGTAVVVPVIPADRVDTDGSSANADIQLAGASLVAHVPVGVGLQSTGGAGQQAGAAQDTLVGAILARTQNNTAEDQAHLAGNGKGFLAQLPASQQLLVNTVVVEGGGAAPLVLSGAGGTQQTALVIDTTGAANGQVKLENVAFAALVGKGMLSGTTDGQVLSGDTAAQHFVVGGVSTSTVQSGGGDDVLELTAAAASTGTAIPGARADTASPRALLLDGGTGADTVQLGRNQADYTVQRGDGHVVVMDKVSGVVATLVNVEAIHFADATLQLDSRAELGTVAALYQNVLGRQADVAGFEFWGANQASHAASLGRIALDILGSAESVARGNVLDGNAAHDVALLYQALFGRAADAAGAAFWTDAMAHGATLVEVTDGMLASAEAATHTLDATNWNLFF